MYLFVCIHVRARVNVGREVLSFLSAVAGVWLAEGGDDGEGSGMDGWRERHNTQPTSQSVVMMMVVVVVVEAALATCLLSHSIPTPPSGESSGDGG